MRELITSSVLLAALAITPYAHGAEPTKQQCLKTNEEAQDLKTTRKLLEAREKLTVCAAASCPALIRQDCARWLNEVNTAMPSLVFEAKDGNGNDLSAVKLTMDGQPLADKLDGGAIEVDPGEHRFAFDSADAHADKTIVAGEGDRDRHVSVVLGSPSAASSAPTGSPVAASPSDGSTQRTIGLVVGGVGVAGVVVGFVFGALALSGSPCNSSDKTCATQGDHDTLVRNETIANVGIGVGLVGLVVGGYLFLTAHPAASTNEPASASIAPWIGWGAAGIAGTFR